MRISHAGFSTKEAGLALLVVVVAAAVVIPIGMSSRSRRSQAVDVQRMRNVYMALAMYETEVDQMLPPDLSLARNYAQNDDQFQSELDPYVGIGGPYPVDGSLPEWKRTSPIRISFAYLYSFAEAGRLHPAPWPKAKFERSLGLIADEWTGTVRRAGNFGATVGGPLWRVTVDGSAVRIPRGGPKPIGNAADLFKQGTRGPS